ncbi:MAG: hypothetical protein R3350_01050 [Saprospiraceae bacterium]|nr:hypothetical protein [Saprospiraceae bacterium]
MQLKRLQNFIAQYEAHLKKAEADRHLHWWAAQRNFQENWDLAAADLPAMYDRSLRNPKTKRLWKREGFEPKRVMLSFFEEQSDLVVHAFRDLFNEDREVGGRIDRFVYYCDELLSLHRKANPTSIDSNHYHGGDYEMISLYLAFRYPDAYAPYPGDLFRELLHKLGTADLPDSHDLVRYFKVMRTLQKFLNRSEHLLRAHEERLDSRIHYTGDSLLLAYDFSRFVCDAAILPDEK